MIIGLDVGGTHTDVVLIGDGCIQKFTKVPTDPSNLFECVLAGLEEVTRGIPPQKLRRLVLSTTLTTNCIVEGKFAEPGMIVSGGPGVDPESFRTGSRFHVVSGSINHRGREIQTVDPAEIKAIGERLRAEGVRQVGVVGKFSARNPVHELQIRELLGDGFELVILGHQLSGQLNFPRRIATAFLNAAVYPRHRQFFEAVQNSLRKKGLNIPIYVLKADGGTMSLEASLTSPGQTMLSGPAASVMGALPFASDEGETLVLDIGGTTTDMAVLIGRAPLLDPLGIEMSGYKTLIRSLKTRSIGLGGDSVVKVEGGVVSIGPERRGPAMAYGGPSVTITDALFVLGKVTGGDDEAARRGLASLAEPLGMKVEEAASLVFDSACRVILEEAAHMVADINSRPVYTVHELLEGYQVRPEEVLILGGPAPYFAFRLAAMTDFNVRVVPQWHVANAVGAALARNTSEVSVFADTERGLCVAPEEDFRKSVSHDFTKPDAVRIAHDLLRRKCAREGAPDEEPEIEIIEESEFNMVRDFYMTGRNIRVKVQVKPGLIPEYRSVAESLFKSCPMPTLPR